MVAAGGGSILNTTSIRALIGTAGADAYTSAKGGVIALTRALALQWAPSRIRVNAISPGVILTPRVKLMLREELMNIISITHFKMKRGKGFSLMTIFKTSRKEGLVN